MNADTDFDVEVAGECIRISKLTPGRAFDRAKVYSAAMDAIRKKHGLPLVGSSPPRRSCRAGLFCQNPNVSEGVDKIQSIPKRHQVIFGTSAGRTRVVAGMIAT